MTVSSARTTQPAGANTGRQRTGGAPGIAAPAPTQSVDRPWHFSADAVSSQRVSPVFLPSVSGVTSVVVSGDECEQPPDGHDSTGAGFVEQHDLTAVSRSRARTLRQLPPVGGGAA